MQDLSIIFTPREVNIDNDEEEIIETTVENIEGEVVVEDESNTEQEIQGNINREF